MGSRFTTILVLGLLNLLTVCYFLTLHSFADIAKVSHSIKAVCCNESVSARASKLDQTVTSFKERKDKRMILVSKLHTKMSKRGNSLVEDMKHCSLAIGMLEEELSELENVAKKAQQFLNALRLVFPRKFSQKFKNPCWYPNFTLTSYKERTLEDKIRLARQLDQSQQTELLKTFKDILRSESNNESQQLFCLPCFFLAGFPKSGTTSLHEALRRHPQIVPPAVKEPHWWTRTPLYDMDPGYLKLVAIRYPLYFKSLARELGHGSNTRQKITYDGTQSLLWGSIFFNEVNYLEYCATPAIMSRILPDAKFIVLLRDPTTREYSNFFYMCTWDKLNQVSQGDPPTQFHHAATVAVNRLHSCLATTNHSLPWCLGDLNSLQRGCGYIGKRLNIGMYYIHLHKWMQFYPKESFLFLKTEEMKRDPERVMAQIADFLRVDWIGDQEAKEWLSVEANVQEDYRTKFIMRPETEKLLNDFYKPYNELLVNLTGSGRFLWT